MANTSLQHFFEAIDCVLCWRVDRTGDPNRSAYAKLSRGQRSGAVLVGFGAERRARRCDGAAEKLHGAVDVRYRGTINVAHPFNADGSTSSP